MINDAEYQIWELQGVLVREEHKLPWTQLSAMPGFEGIDAEGVDGKYFGKEDLGPFAYQVRLAPGVILPARTYRAAVMRFVLSGSFGDSAAQGWFELRAAPGPIPAMAAGPDGCVVFEVYQSNPRVALLPGGVSVSP